MKRSLLVNIGLILLLVSAIYLHIDDMRLLNRSIAVRTADEQLIGALTQSLVTANVKNNELEIRLAHCVADINNAFAARRLERMALR